MLNLDWLNWDNPVAFWWVFLACISLINICLWSWSQYYLRKKASSLAEAILIRRSLWLSAGYTFGCAFRSFLPRADVQRIVLFDSWWSSVFVGRSVATIAELCFIAQWALTLHYLAISTNDRIADKISRIVFPLIFIAECFSWYAVITTNYLGNTVEESLWTISYTLIALALISLWRKFLGAIRWAFAFAILGCVLYVIFMSTVDVPMYWQRHLTDLAQAKPYLGFFAGLRDLNTRWHLTYAISDWRTEIPWMSLYFSVAVWTSIALCYVPYNSNRIRQYLRNL